MRFMGNLRTYTKSNFYPAIKKQDHFVECQNLGSPLTGRQKALQLLKAAR